MKRPRYDYVMISFLVEYGWIAGTVILLLFIMSRW